MVEEQKSISATWAHPDTGQVYNFYSTDGNLKTQQQFEAAIAQFDEESQRVGVEKATTPTGFTALPKGSIKDTLRVGFESVNQPFQQIVREMPEANKEMGFLGNLFRPASDLSQFIADQVNTPERAAVTGALVATGVGPIGKALK
ncbi:MAG: hypothetical protein ACRCZI_14890, partial [Cetobacterium sp.]